jgi:hypothetical protein
MVQVLFDFARRLKHEVDIMINVLIGRIVFYPLTSKEVMFLPVRNFLVFGSSVVQRTMILYN